MVCSAEPEALCLIRLCHSAQCGTLITWLLIPAGDALTIIRYMFKLDLSAIAHCHMRKYAFILQNISVKHFPSDNTKLPLCKIVMANNQMTIISAACWTIAIVPSIQAELVPIIRKKVFMLDQKVCKSHEVPLWYTCAFLSECEPFLYSSVWVCSVFSCIDCENEFPLRG